MIFVNFKIYKQTFADGAVKLAKICKNTSDKLKVKIVPVVSAFDLYRVKSEVGGEVYVQGGDLFFEGAYTGATSILQAVCLGADGVVLNHSEKKLPPGKVAQILVRIKKDSWVKKLAKKYPEIKSLESRFKNFKVIVCFRSLGQAKKWVNKLKPVADYYAFEPPELIGGDVSVAVAKPKSIEKVVKILAGKPVIVGAGIKTRPDVEKSLLLGAKGVLVSSDIVKASDPEKELKEMAEAFV
jgi:triosephosphate isomerase (TIM)